MKKQTSRLVVIAVLALLGCAKERPVKPVLNNVRRLEKNIFTDTHFFAKTVTGARFAGDTELQGTPVGQYEISNVLVQFKIKETSMDIVAIDPLFKDTKAALGSTVLASFPIKHIDVLRKQNPDGDDTNEEEETETRRPWNERSYISIDIEKDTQDAYVENTKSTSSTGVKVEDNGTAINFDVTRLLKDNSEVKERYSFLKYTPSKTYVQKEYPLDLQTQFGYFKTTTLAFDKFDRITNETKKEYINRWDTSKKIVYYLSPNYPEHLKAFTKTVFAKWNEAFKEATGHDTVEVRENTGQELGDLRYSMIYYDDTPDAAHGILGYGPHYTNPRTGEVIKADVMLFGGVLKSAIFSDKIREKILGQAAQHSQSIEEQELRDLRNKVVKSAKGADTLDLKALARSKSLLSKVQLDKELVQEALPTKHLQQEAKELKKNLVKELRASMTTVNDSVMNALAKRSGAMSDEEVEKTIFIPLLTHELGHTFGLRHNFMASMDKNHFGKDSQTSSVMDYGFLSSEEGTEPGSYDKAAIAVSYANDVSRTDRLVKENFFYCTDEHTMSSQLAFCNRFDKGTSLSEIIVNQKAAYDVSWLIRNTRLNNVFMRYSRSEYRQRVIMSLLPLRFVYDHANSIIEAIDGEDYQAVWILARQRVQPDASSDPKNVEEVEILSGYQLLGEETNFKPQAVTIKRQVDKVKMQALKLDASFAKKLALEALRDIVINSKRPNYDIYDTLNGDLQIRGVILDKILALDFLGARFSSPLGDGTVTTTFPNVDEEAVTPTLFRQVLSNIVLAGEPGSNPDPNGRQPSFDINLREAAMAIVREEFADPSQASMMHNLLALAIVPQDVTSAEGKALEDYKKLSHEKLVKIYSSELTEEERNKILDELNTLDRQRSRILYAETATIANRVFHAPLFTGGLGMTTATGFFIRDAINPYETVVDALNEAYSVLVKELRAEEAKPKDIQNKDRISALGDKLDDMGRSIQNLSQYVESQKASLDMMYRVYDKQ